MHDSKFKPDSELIFALKDKKSIALFSCNLCANFCTAGITGGYQGMMFMKEKLKAWGKNIIVARTVTGCCAEPILEEAFDIYLKPVVSSCDAIVMLCCAAGIKTAFLRAPGIPIIAALDSFGSLPVTRKIDDLISDTPCTGCGRCVISYTNGICPVGRCPEKRQFGPCDNAPMASADKRCVIDRRHNCIWREIADRGSDLDALKKLEEMYDTGMNYPILADTPSSGPAFMRKIIGWLMARTSAVMGKIIPFFN